MERALNKLNEVMQRTNAAHLAWLRHTLTLAAGTLALLVALRPEAVSPLAAVLLAGTWVLLGLGLCCGSAATFIEVDLLKQEKEQLRQAYMKCMREGRYPEFEGQMVVAPRWYLLAASKVTSWALLLAVVFLVSFAIIDLWGRLAG